MASLAAILAIGKPVAFDASALERDTRGFISMTMSRPSAGSMANWMLQPPVSTPTSRRISMPRSRIVWYSRSVSVIAGATVTESPVCTPIGSKFSIEQTTTTLSRWSRISSSSNSFQPKMDSSISTLARRRGGQPVAGHPLHVLDGVRHAGAEAAHREGRPHHDGQAEFGDRLADLVHREADRDFADSPPTLATMSLNFCRSSPRWMASKSAPISLDAVALQHAVLVQRDGGVQRGLPAEGGQQRVDLVAALGLLGDDLLDERRGDRLDVGVVGELRVGHDRRRVGVDQADLQALGAQHPAGLGARVVELAGLPDDDRPGADDQDVVEVGTTRHYSPSPAIRSTNWSNRYSASCGPAAASGWYCTEKARPSTQFDAFDDTVVGAGVADHGATERGVELLARLAFECEAVVLRGDRDPTGGVVDHRDVDAAVTERHLVGRAAQRPAEDLVAEADAEQAGFRRRAPRG